MEKLINELFERKDSIIINDLIRDKNIEKLMVKEIGKKLLDNDNIILESPINQLILMVANSTFADSEEECCTIVSIIQWGIRTTDIIPMASEHRGRDLAYRCLLSLGFLQKYMYYRYKIRAYPHPSFYRNIGSQSFKNIGMTEISNHFDKWENFISEFFV